VLPPLILQFSLVTALAFVGGFVAKKLHLPLIVGYILVGVFLGALLTEGFSNAEFFNFFSEIGIALLLFTLGVEFNFDHLKAIGKSAGLGAGIQIIVVGLAGFLILPAIIGVTYLQALFISFAIALSSTAVVSKILYERGETTASYGELSLGWLVAQDLLVLPVMVVLGLVGKNLPAGNFVGVVGEIVLSTTKALAVLYFALIFGKKIIPRVFRSLALTERSELLLLASFSFALIFAYGANFFGVSFAIGAFLAGLALSSAVINHEVFSQMRPIRDLFSCFFFVSIGFLATQNFSLSNIPSIAILFIITFILKTVVVFVVAVKLGFHTKVSFYATLAIFGVGEFSFVIGKFGKDLGALDANAFNVLTATCALTLIATPFVSSQSSYVYKATVNFIRSRLPRFYKKFVYEIDHGKSFPREKEENISNHVIIVGYGRVGREVAKVLDYANVNYVVTDYNITHLKDLKAKGKPFVYGDATNEDILTSAGIKTCRAIIIAIPDALDGEIILNHCLRLNPDAKFVARAHKDSDAARLKVRGVSSVIEPEFEASLSLVRHALYSLEVSLEEIESLLAKARRAYRF
jgi:CPA2 family monovalent cation:H+ antiporter-2